MGYNEIEKQRSVVSLRHKRYRYWIWLSWLTTKVIWLSGRIQQKDTEHCDFKSEVSLLCWHNWNTRVEIIDARYFIQLHDLDHQLAYTGINNHLSNFRHQSDEKLCWGPYWKHMLLIWNTQSSGKQNSGRGSRRNSKRTHLQLSKSRDQRIAKDIQLDC